MCRARSKDLILKYLSTALKWPVDSLRDIKMFRALYFLFTLCNLIKEGWRSRGRDFLKLWFPGAVGSGSVRWLLLSLSDWSVGTLSVQGSFMPTCSWTLLGLGLLLPADGERWSVTYPATSVHALFMSGNVPRGAFIVTVTCCGWRGPGRVRSDVRNLAANSNFAEAQGL